MRLYEIENYREKIVVFEGVAFRSKESNWWYVSTGCSANACVGSNFDKDGWTEYVEPKPKPKEKHVMYRHWYLYSGVLRSGETTDVWEKYSGECFNAHLTQFLKTEIVKEFEV